MRSIQRILARIWRSIGHADLAWAMLGHLSLQAWLQSLGMAILTAIAGLATGFPWFTALIGSALVFALGAFGSLFIIGTKHGELRKCVDVYIKANTAQFYEVVSRLIQQIADRQDAAGNEIRNLTVYFFSEFERTMFFRLDSICNKRRFRPSDKEYVDVLLCYLEHYRIVQQHVEEIMKKYRPVPG